MKWRIAGRRLRTTTIWASFCKWRYGLRSSLWFPGGERTLFIVDLVDDVLEHFIDILIRLGTRLDVLHVIVLG